MTYVKYKCTVRLYVCKAEMNYMATCIMNEDMNECIALFFSKNEIFYAQYRYVQYTSNA